MESNERIQQMAKIIVEAGTKAGAEIIEKLGEMESFSGNALKELQRELERQREANSALKAILEELEAKLAEKAEALAAARIELAAARASDEAKRSVIQTLQFTIETLRRKL